MSATFQWSETNLVGAVVTDGITNLNFGSADNHDLNTSTYYVIRGVPSFEKYIRCKFSDSYTEISGMKFWKSLGTLLTGEVIKASANAVYATPTIVSNGDSAVPTTEGTALSIQSAEGAATIIEGASGVSGYTGYIRLQTTSTVSTPTGAANQKTFTFQYDEV